MFYNHTDMYHFRVGWQNKKTNVDGKLWYDYIGTQLFYNKWTI